jgi:hypothetical protein
MKKESSIQFFKALGNSAKEGLIGGTSKAKKINKGILFPERLKASGGFKALKSAIGKDKKIHRARVKSPSSIKEKGVSKLDELDDLLGVQIYSKNPAKDAIAMKKHLKNSKIKWLDRKGYKGINIKGDYKGTPTEIQLSPNRVSNIGQTLQHHAYKPPSNFTEWDVKQADRVGTYLVNKISKPWKEIFKVKK